jgi:hypothetical protein
VRWRKATWALIIWTALMAVWLFYALANPATSEERYVPFVIVFTAIALILCWFIGLVILALVWFMSRPKANTPIYGPQGQWMRVTEKEAKRRVEKEGWTYQPPRLYPQQPYQGQQPPYGGPPRPPPAGPGQP